MILLLLPLPLALLWWGLESAQRRKWRTRLAKLARPAVAAAIANAPSIRREQADSSIKSLDALIKRYLPRLSELRRRLVMSGTGISTGVYLLGSLALASIGAAAGIFLGLASLTALAAGAALGLMIPHILIGGRIKGRHKKFLAQFPEALDVMVRGLKSGVPTSESIIMVGREMPAPVSDVFRDVSDAGRMGLTLSEALASVSARLGIPEFRYFEIALSIQQETGGNLSETLENLSTTLRRRKQMKQKVKALSSEARAGATILGALPFLMFGALEAMNPDYMSVMIHDPRGHTLIFVALGLLGAGVGVMVQMGNFEI